MIILAYLKDDLPAIICASAASIIREQATRYHGWLGLSVDIMLIESDLLVISLIGFGQNIYCFYSDNA